MLRQRIRCQVRMPNTLDTAVRIESTRRRPRVRANQPDAWSVYDALGNRVATKINDVWQLMVYDAFGKLVAEYGVSAEGAGGAKYVQQDWQGSVRAVANSNGHVVARTDHQAFGEEIGVGVGLKKIEQGYSADRATRQGYALTEDDSSSGLQTALWRNLETKAAKWTRPDPYFGSLRRSNPQSFNRYSYVLNDPINFVDPSGLYEAFVHKAMTELLGRLAGLSTAEADKLANYTGDGEGGADSFDYAATSPQNVVRCGLGAGPSVMTHFPSAAQLRANIRNYPGYMSNCRSGNEAYCQQAGFVLHSIQDSMGAHKGYSNRLCKGHARHRHAPDRKIGDAKFIAASNKVLQVMAQNKKLQLNNAQINILLDYIVSQCQGVSLTVIRPGLGGGMAWGSGGGRNSSRQWDDGRQFDWLELYYRSLYPRVVWL